jgi:hypothetical protein
VRVYVAMQAESHPFFLGVDDGMHTLTAALTHPYTGAVIPVSPHATPHPSSPHQTMPT